jgi:hypothetical protein
MEDIEKYKRAKERLEELKGFYIHGIIYILVNLAMAIFNIISTPDYYWFFFPLIGWGIGLVIHALSVYANGKLFGANWEEKKIRQLMDKDKL